MANTQSLASEAVLEEQLIELATLAARILERDPDVLPVEPLYEHFLAGHDWEPALAAQVRNVLVRMLTRPDVPLDMIEYLIHEFRSEALRAQIQDILSAGWGIGFGQVGPSGGGSSVSGAV